MIEVMYIYCAISRYIDYCDRPSAATALTWGQSATAATPFPSSLERSTRVPKEHKECDAHPTGREELACCLMYQTDWRRTFCNKLLGANTILEWENGNSVWIQSKWLRCCTDGILSKRIDWHGAQIFNNTCLKIFSNRDKWSHAV